MHLVTRAWNKLNRHTLKLLGRDSVSGLRITSAPSLERIGSDYGGWIVPTDRFTKESVCYCAGVGEDITFDLGLIERFGCTVHAFDPTPRAREHVQNHADRYPSYEFEPIGIWDEDATVKFYEPKDPAHVSHSALNLQQTDRYFEAACKRLGGIMEHNGHDRLDLLKLDIEGAEYKVVESLVADGLDVRVLCVEYDEAFHPLDSGYKQRIRRSLQRLIDYGFALVAVDGKCNYTLLREPPA